MEKPNKIPLIYGYTICLAAVICFLISVSNIISSISNLSDPFHADRSSTDNLASFESYKLDVLHFRSKDEIPDDQSLCATYEAVKADKIQTVQHTARRSIIMDGGLIVICVVLFITHWTWMKTFTPRES